MTPYIRSRICRLDVKLQKKPQISKKLGISVELVEKTKGETSENKGPVR